MGIVSRVKGKSMNGIWSCTSRRGFMLGSSAFVLLPTTGLPQSGDCSNINAARALVEAQVQGIGIWVATDGLTIVANARAKLAQLKQAMPATGTQVDIAQREELIDFLSVTLGASLAIVGIAYGIGAAPMILGGMTLSTGLLMAEALLSPETLNPVEAAVVTTADQIDHVLAALAQEGGTLSARQAAGRAGNILATIQIGYDFMCFLDSLQGTVVAEATFAAMTSEIATLEAALAHASQGAGLMAIRQEALDTLLNELIVLPCVSSPLP